MYIIRLFAVQDDTRGKNYGKIRNYIISINSPLFTLPQICAISKNGANSPSPPNFTNSPFGISECYRENDVACAEGQAAYLE